MGSLRILCLLLALACLACVVSGTETGTESLSLEEIGDLSEVVPSEHKAYIAKLVQGELSRMLGGNQLAVKLKQRNEALRKKLLQGGFKSSAGGQMARRDLRRCKRERKALEGKYARGAEICHVQVNRLRAAQSKLQRKLDTEKKIAAAAQTQRGASFTKLQREKDKAEGLLKAEQMRSLNLKDKLKVSNDYKARVKLLKLALSSSKSRNSVLQKEVKTLQGAHESTKREHKTLDSKYTIQMRKLKTLEAEAKKKETGSLAKLEDVFRKHKKETRSFHSKLAAQSGQIQMLKFELKMAKKADKKYHQLSKSRLKRLDAKDATIRDLASKLAEARLRNNQLASLKKVSDGIISRQKIVATEMGLRLKLAREQAGIHNKNDEQLLGRIKDMKASLWNQEKRWNHLRLDLKTAVRGGGKYSGKARKLSKAFKRQTRRLAIIREHLSLLNARMTHRKAKESMVKREHKLALKSSRGAQINTLLEAARKKEEKISSLKDQLLAMSKNADAKLAVVYQQHETSKTKLRREVGKAKGELAVAQSEQKDCKKQIHDLQKAPLEMAKQNGKLRIELQRAQRDHKEATLLYVSFKKKHSAEKAALAASNKMRTAANEALTAAKLGRKRADLKIKQLSDQLKQTQAKLGACDKKAEAVKDKEIDDTGLWKRKLAKSKAHCQGVQEKLKDKLNALNKSMKLSSAAVMKAQKDAMESKLAEKRAVAMYAKHKKEGEVDLAKREQENAKLGRENDVLRRKLQIIKDEQEESTELAGRRGGVFAMRTTDHAFTALRTTLRSYKKEHNQLEDELKHCQDNLDRQQADVKSYQEEVAALKTQARKAMNTNFMQQNAGTAAVSLSTAGKKLKVSGRSTGGQQPPTSGIGGQAGGSSYRSSVKDLEDLIRDVHSKPATLGDSDEGNSLRDSDELLAAPLWGTKDASSDLSAV